jgi:hypothetical protein
MSTLTVPDFNKSGLGDRLCGMLLIAVYARIHGFSKVKVPWPSYSIPGGKPPEFRKKDILLSNVLEHLILPNGFEFVDGHETLPRTDPWWYTQVGIGSPNFLWFARNHLKSFSLEDVLEVAQQVCNECDYRPELVRISVDLGDYVSVHIRRTDKVRPVSECSFMISESELDDLNLRTRKAIEEVVAQGHRRFFICSDDDLALDSYQNFVSDLGCDIVKLPDMEKSASTYYDLAAISRSKLLIQSMRSSAFSNYAACIGGVPIKNVYTDNIEKFL